MTGRSFTMIRAMSCSGVVARAIRAIASRVVATLSSTLATSCVRRLDQPCAWPASLDTLPTRSLRAMLALSMRMCPTLRGSASSRIIIRSFTRPTTASSPPVATGAFLDATSLACKNGSPLERIVVALSRQCQTPRNWFQWPTTLWVLRSKPVRV